MGYRVEYNRCCECGGRLVARGSELVCSRCGLVNGLVAGEPDPEDYLGRQLANPAVWHKNLGSTFEETRRVISELRRRGLVRLSDRDVLVYTIIDRLKAKGYSGTLLDTVRKALTDALDWDEDLEYALRVTRVRRLSVRDVLGLDDPFTREAITILVNIARESGWSEVQIAEAARRLRKRLKQFTKHSVPAIARQLALDALLETASALKIALTVKY